MLESEMNARLHRSFSHYLKESKSKGFWLKIRDDGLPQPFDIVGCVPPGRMFAIESKVCRLKDTLNLKVLFSGGRIHQLETLDRINEIGGIGLVLVSRKEAGQWNCYMMSPKICKGILANGGSVSIKEAVESGMMVELRNEGFGIWRLDNIFKK